MATTKKTSSKKTIAAKSSKVKMPKDSAQKRQSTASLLNKIAQLDEQVNASADEQGKLIEALTNNRIKLDAMLGQILKGLYLVGIDPDMIMKKCQQMFQKMVVAD